jgi:hypothetical protein
VSGASSVEELENIIKMAGFVDVSVKEKPVSKEYEEKWGSGLSVGEFIMSSTITARKPPVQE